MDLKLTDEQTELLLAELDRIIENDRHFLSPRILALRNPGDDKALPGASAPSAADAAL
jgi:hypothetical protein